MKQNNRDKKSKTIDLGTVRKGKKGGKFFSFDKSVKKVTLTREIVKDGEKFTEVVNIEPNDDGYLNSFINTAEEYVSFKLNNDYITQSKADEILESFDRVGITSVFSAKVTS